MSEQSTGLQFRGTNGAIQARLTELRQQIQDLRIALGATSRQYNLFRRRIRPLSLSLAYLTSALNLRKATSAVFDWHWPAIVIGSAMFGAFACVITFSIIGTISGVTVGAVLISLLYYVPGDSALAASTQWIKDERSRLLVEADALRIRKARILGRIADSEEELCAAEQRLREAEEEEHRRQKELEEQQRRSSRRQELLRSNWKALRSVPFENFLEQVFQELGYSVETTRVTGDQGGDLIVARNGTRIAIQIKGYFNSVSNSAVQEAFTARAYYGCSSCAVITNSRFTPAAKELAERVGCLLVDEDTLPRLITGEWDFIPKQT